MIDFTDPQQVLARTLWGEARGDGKDGMQAVANVICTRAANPMWWGNSTISVCLKPWQFSTWNARLPGQSPDGNYLATVAVEIDDPAFETANSLAAMAVRGVLPDITGGADSYYALTMPSPPTWATPDKFTVQIGNQKFYRLRAAAALTVA